MCFSSSFSPPLLPSLFLFLTFLLNPYYCFFSNVWRPLKGRASVQGPLSLFSGSLPGQLGRLWFRESGVFLSTNGLHWRSEGKECHHTCPNKAGFPPVLKVWEVLWCAVETKSSLSIPPATVPSFQAERLCCLLWLPAGRCFSQVGRRKHSPLPLSVRLGAWLCQESCSLLCLKSGSAPRQAFFSSCSRVLVCYFHLSASVVPIYFLFKTFIKNLWSAYITLTVLSTAIVFLFPVKFYHHFNQILRGREGNHTCSI